MARCVDGLGDELFTRSGFTLDENRRIDSGDVANLLIDLLHRRALAQQIIKLRALIEQTAQIMNFSDVHRERRFCRARRADHPSHPLRAKRAGHRFDPSAAESGSVRRSAFR